MYNASIDHLSPPGAEKVRLMSKSSYSYFLHHKNQLYRIIMILRIAQIAHNIKHYNLDHYKEDR